MQFTKPYIGLGDENTPWTPAPEELLELSTITSNFCKVTKDNNNIILSDFSADQGYIEFEVPYGDDWTINHRVNITRNIKFRPLAFDNRLLKFQDRLLHIRETPHIMYSELMDYAYSNNIETPPTSNLRALNYLYKNLESEGLDMFDLLYNFAYINTPEQFKLLNLWNKRGYDGTAYGGLMWSNEGVQGNGVNGYIVTNFNPSLLVEGQKYQLNNASRGGVVSNIGTSIGNNATMDSATSQYNHLRINIDGQFAINSGQSSINGGNMAGVGFKGVNRFSQENITLINRETLYNNSAEVSILPTLNQVILRGIFSVNYYDGTLSSYFIGAALIYEQTQTFRQIYNKYLSSIGLTPIA